jgi:hypothetical protein
MSGILPKKNEPPKVSIFRRQDWFLSAGLVMVIYFIIWLCLHLSLLGDHPIRMIVHVLPLFALMLALIGYSDRSRKREEEHERRKKRRQAEYALTKMQQQDAATRAAAPGAKEDHLDEKHE